MKVAHLHIVHMGPAVLVGSSEVSHLVEGLLLMLQRRPSLGRSQFLNFSLVFEILIFEPRFLSGAFSVNGSVL